MDTGGAELRSLDLVKAFDPLLVRFEFVTLTGRRGVLAQQFECAGATVLPIELGWRFPFQFIRYLRQTDPRVLQSPVALFSGVILFLGRLAGVPIRVAHFHSDGDGQRDTRLREMYRGLMRRLIDRYATHIIGVSPSALSKGLGGSLERDSRACVIPNGVDVSALPRLPQRRSAATRILSLGRAAPEKNLARMPAVLSAYLRYDSEARLDIVGPRSGGIDERVLESAAKYGVVERVHLHEETSDVGSVLAQSDVLLVTSTREGLPSVVIEAAAVGVPVVSSDVGGSVWIGRSFPWVRCLSLDETDDVWARTLLTAVQTKPDAEEARRSFVASPFTLQANVASLCAIYGVPGAGTELMCRRPR